MASHDVWNLLYALGKTDRVMGDSENPQRRARALDGAATITKNGWRCWVEHKDTGKRIFENPAETAHRQAQEAKLVIRFAEDHVPGFARR